MDAHIYACDFQHKERAFWMAIALSLSSTKSKRPERTDGDEVSGKLFHYSPSPNLKLCGQWDIEVVMTKWCSYSAVIHEVILLKIYSFREMFSEYENLA